MENITNKIPENMRQAASEKLTDIILNAQNTEKMSATLAKTILRQWQNNQLTTETGIQNLIQAAITVDPEKTIISMEEMGLTELAQQLKTQKGA
jgi:hypothetical protein